MDQSGKAKEEEMESGTHAPKELLEFPEHFNQLELLETHRHLIPTGTQSLWEGDSDEEEEQDEKTEEWYQAQENKLEKEPEKLLLWAAEKNRMATVQRLLAEEAARVNARDEDEYTALHRAAYNGHLAIARELVSRGADVHAVTADGWTPLHSACRWDHASVAAFLLQHEADVNAQTRGLLTPLHLAAGNRDGKNTLELLLMNRYVRPGLKNNAGETALDVARRSSVYHYLFEIVEGCTNSSPPES
ncbi:ankyrin repeat domain-containing protein 49 [Tachyglossus aculeatus]|uniref:ankyrin repeat domain-containing protein 49 n=1 Tax=Tachyglossus aculeatus TaxID=9261 RepID=UPI0018F296D8|nr:ankyrin repeat domain-containing protein 49 [Tachyglossus aculeatus]XP_038617680.1 ankyrin repeat domain-containing protein 49 [Tachyglossus aculeatus]